MESNNKGLGGFLLGRRGRELAMVRGELIAGNERGVRVRRKRVKGFFFWWMGDRGGMVMWKNLGGFGSALWRGELRNNGRGFDGRGEQMLWVVLQWKALQ